MNYHDLKKTINLCFPQKYQIKITKIGKNVMKLHCIIAYKPAFTAFQDKGCIHLYPKKNHVHIRQ